jgi:hypothetical protein
MNEEARRMKIRRAFLLAALDKATSVTLIGS